MRKPALIAAIDQLRVTADNMRIIASARIDGLEDAATIARNQDQLQTLALATMGGAVDLLAAIVEAGSSVPVKGDIRAGMIGPLNDAFDDARAEAWKRTRTFAEEGERDAA